MYTDHPISPSYPSSSQCARRSRKCEYPTESRRGQHKRKDRSGTSAKAAPATGESSGEVKEEAMDVDVAEPGEEQGGGKGKGREVKEEGEE